MSCRQSSFQVRGTQHQQRRLQYLTLCCLLSRQSPRSLFRSPSLTPVSSEGTQRKQRRGTELPPKSSAASSRRASPRGQADLSTGKPQPAARCRLPAQALPILSQVSAVPPRNFWAALPAAQRFSVHLYLKAAYTHPSPPAPSVPPPTRFSAASQMVSS